VHDLEGRVLGKVVPYGVHDVGTNARWVSLDITSDTAELAVNADRTWIEQVRGPAKGNSVCSLSITA
jgi:hypothetical protein